jgi:hypothetical protein
MVNTMGLSIWADATPSESSKSVDANKNIFMRASFSFRRICNQAAPPAPKRKAGRVPKGSRDHFPLKQGLRDSAALFSRRRRLFLRQHEFFCSMAAPVSRGPCNILVSMKLLALLALSLVLTALAFLKARRASVDEAGQAT